MNITNKKYIRIRSVILWLLLVISVYLVPLFGQIASPEKTGVYLDRTFEKADGKLMYRIMFPYDFDRKKSYPLVVFLHGSGERGLKNKKQLVHGSKLFQDSLAKYPAIVLFPQCPPTDYWANISPPDKDNGSGFIQFQTDDAPTSSLQMTMELIHQLLSQPFIDERRLYVSGLSMGGMGVWELLWRMPEKIAAALPICGAGPHQKAGDMIHIPIWVFHGVDDNVVHPRYSIRMTKAVQQAGGIAKISLYPNTNHNSWDRAFAEPSFLKWMFSKRKK